MEGIWSSPLIVEQGFIFLSEIILRLSCVLVSEKILIFNKLSEYDIWAAPLIADRVLSCDSLINFMILFIEEISWNVSYSRRYQIIWEYLDDFQLGILVLLWNFGSTWSKSTAEVHVIFLVFFALIASIFFSFALIVLNFNANE
jgi:hypothetical protein